MKSRGMGVTTRTGRGVVVVGGVNRAVITADGVAAAANAAGAGGHGLGGVGRVAGRRHRLRAGGAMVGAI